MTVASEEKMQSCHSQLVIALSRYDLIAYHFCRDHSKISFLQSLVPTGTVISEENIFFA
jgi:hypothetical protein